MEEDFSEQQVRDHRVRDLVEHEVQELHVPEWMDVVVIFLGNELVSPLLVARRVIVDVDVRMASRVREPLLAALLMVTQ